MDTQIIIAEDHPLFRTALQSALNQALGTPKITETDSIASLQNALDTASPDLVLLDLNMPGAHGFSGLLYMRGQHPNVPVVVISAQEDESVIRKAIGYGAAGFIPKSSSLDVIKNAVKDVLHGKNWIPSNIDMNVKMEGADSEMEKRIASLTPQQFRVLGMISEGMLNKQIAYDLDVSEATIKAHVTAIFRKLGVRNRTQAVIALQQLELEEPGGAKSDNSAPTSE
ncbi:response regulator transcription factor [Sansalvadorimonas sp. 2012CJ34-2]|uniref:Response regulator transcription factor n=1 Tax=Parendozoicomonas callyspongiae TaxID=2942213 RepID=A0ABT0PH63_9GAMM|nr:response regulator transcription factor [Sansalvadorimonas sp. 2012CJ34-2]MCL6270704.1 response regulator transcription factor [Sansalvadorimonas sp. 2012CJ34-2]